MEDRKQQFRHARHVYRDGKPAEALAILDKLFQEQPKDKDIIYARGLCLLALGRFEDVRAICERLAAMHADDKAEHLRKKLKAEQSVKKQAIPAAAESPTGKRRLVLFGGVIAVLAVVAAAFLLLNGRGAPPEVSGERRGSVTIHVTPDQMKVIESLAKDVVCFTPANNPISSLHGLKDNEFASWVTSPDIPQKFMAAFGRENTVVGLRFMGTGDFSFGDDPQLRLFITHEPYAEDIINGGGARIKFKPATSEEVVKIPSRKPSIVKGTPINWGITDEKSLSVKPYSLLDAWVDYSDGVYLFVEYERIRPVDNSDIRGNLCDLGVRINFVRGIRDIRDFPAIQGVRRVSNETRRVGDSYWGYSGTPLQDVKDKSKKGASALVCLSDDEKADLPYDAGQVSMPLIGSEDIPFFGEGMAIVSMGDFPVLKAGGIVLRQLSNAMFLPIRFPPEEKESANIIPSKDQPGETKYADTDADQYAGKWSGKQERGFTVETFKQIESGMSLTQVQGILGEGQLLSKGEVLKMGGAVFFQPKGSSNQVYVWRKGKTVIAVILDEDRVKKAYAEISPDVLSLGANKTQISGVIPLVAW